MSILNTKAKELMILSIHLLRINIFIVGFKRNSVPTLL